MMINQFFIYIQRVEELRVESGQQHIDHNGDIYFVGMWIIFITILLIFDTLLYVLIVRVKLFNDIISAILLVIISNNLLQCLFFAIGFLLVVYLFLL